MGFKGQTAFTGFGAADSDEKKARPGKEPRTEPKLLAGRFRILRKIAAGGMGMVFLARQTSIDRDVAIKILNPDKAGDREARERFKTEAAAVSRLKSPHTVTVFDFGEDDHGNMFLAMEFLEGRPLSAYMKEHGPIESRLVAEVADQVLDSLVEAHAAGVLHRDLKPENIFVMDRSIREIFVKVLDFGVAKIVGGPAEAGTLPGKVFGTPSYMSPEQLMGKSLDERTDLYSLGVVMFEMLTGVLPINGSSPIEIGVRKVKDIPPRIDQVAPEAGFPPAMVDFLASVLHPDPGMRPSDDAEFRDMMHSAFDRRTSVQAAPRLPDEAGPERGRGGAPRDTVPMSAMGSDRSGEKAASPRKSSAAAKPVTPARPVPEAKAATTATTATTVTAATPAAIANRDRRRARRTPKLLSVKLILAGEVSPATASDVSPTGGFINARELPSVGHRMVIAFKRPDSTQFDIQVACEVTRIATGESETGGVRGFGVRWLKLRAPGEIAPVLKFLGKTLGVEITGLVPGEHTSPYWEYGFAEGRFV